MKLRYLLSAVAMLTIGAAWGATLTYTGTALATGSLNNVAFTDAALTLTFTGSTSNLVAGSNYYENFQSPPLFQSRV